MFPKSGNNPQQPSTSKMKTFKIQGISGFANSDFIEFEILEADGESDEQGPSAIDLFSGDQSDDSEICIIEDDEPEVKMETDDIDITEDPLGEPDDGNSSVPEKKYENVEKSVPEKKDILIKVNNDFQKSVSKKKEVVQILNDNIPSSEPEEEDTSVIVCSYALCRKNSKKNPNLRMYVLPIHDTQLLRHWTENSGNIHLQQLREKDLLKKYICEDHFLDCSYQNPITRNRLKVDAVPTPSPVKVFDVISSCVMPNCGTVKNAKNNVVLFNAPSDKTERELWEYCFPSLPDIKLQEFNLVCEKHFYKEDILLEVQDDKTVVKKLKPGAIPCPDIKKGCCVPNCVNKSTNTDRMYHLPINGDLNTWLNKISSRDLEDVPKIELLKYRLCDLHFNKSHAKYVVPSLNLPTVCVIPNCKVMTDLFKVPSNPKERAIWQLCVKVADIKLRDSDLICFKHFYKNDMTVEKNTEKTKRHLKPGAIPCWNIIPGCSVITCRNNDRDTDNMVHLPVLGNYRKWLESICRYDLYNLTRTELLRYRICELHFNQTLPGLPAIFNLPPPSLNLPSPNTKCLIPTCKNVTDGKCVFFKPPAYQMERDIWQLAIQIDNFILNDSYIICEKHFYKGDIIKELRADKTLVTTLKPGAVPCVDIIKGCCVPECVNKNRDTNNMYHIPVSGDTYAQWVNAINSPELIGKSKLQALRYRVCEIHFDPVALQRVRYIKPHLNLAGKRHYGRMLERYLERKKEWTGAQAAEMAKIADKPSVSDQPPVSVEPDKDTLVFNTSVCAFKGCDKEPSDSDNFFKLPPYLERGKKWLQSCGRTDILSLEPKDILTVLKTSVGVCPLHVGSKKYSSESSNQEDDHMEVRVSKAFGNASSSKQNIPATPKVISSHIKLQPLPKNVIIKKMCAYKNCMSNLSRAVLYDFPKDEEMRNKWIEQCCAQEILKTVDSLDHFLKYFGVCKSHFALDQFDSNNKDILATAIPMLYKEKVVTVPAMNTETVVPPCAVSTCSGDSEPFHKFPNPITDLDRFYIWIRLVSGDRLKKISPNVVLEKYKVCNKHFEDWCFTNESSLQENAVPTRFLSGKIYWLSETNFFKTKLLEYYKDDPEVVVQWKDVQVNEEEKDNVLSKCVLLENGIKFPNLGKMLYMGERPLIRKRRFPFEIYKYNKMTKSLGLSEDVDIGERLEIHTAIIIDDDDDSERDALLKIFEILNKNDESQL